MVGCLSYIQGMICRDLTMQCMQFCNSPKHAHEEAVKCYYLSLCLKTKDQGLVLKPDTTKGLECYLDADWAGSWQDHSSHDPIFCLIPGWVMLLCMLHVQLCGAPSFKC